MSRKPASTPAQPPPQPPLPPPNQPDPGAPPNPPPPGTQPIPAISDAWAKNVTVAHPGIPLRTLTDDERNWGSLREFCGGGIMDESA